MSRILAFGRFWVEFVIGDDWRIAAGLAGALGIGAVVVHAGAPGWWVVPLAVAVLLGVSLWRAARLPAEPAGESEALSAPRATGPPS